MTDHPARLPLPLPCADKNPPPAGPALNPTASQRALEVWMAPLFPPRPPPLCAMLWRVPSLDQADALDSPSGGLAPLSSSRELPEGRATVPTTQTPKRNFWGSPQKMSGQQPDMRPAVRPALGPTSWRLPFASVPTAALRSSLAGTWKLKHTWCWGRSPLKLLWVALRQGKEGPGISLLGI